MDNYMENFKIVESTNGDYDLFLILLFCHSKVNQRKNIVERLNEIHFEGTILVDNLMQVGVEGLRFYKTEFKEDFLDEGYPVQIEKDSIYRKYTCDFLREHNLVNGSNLSDRKIKQINEGQNI